MTEIIKKNKIREIFKKKGFRIGNKALKEFSSKAEKGLEIYLKKAERNALISGRKTIKSEDFER